MSTSESLSRNSMKAFDSLVELDSFADQVHKPLHHDEEKDENEQSKPEFRTRHSTHAATYV